MYSVTADEHGTGVSAGYGTYLRTFGNGNIAIGTNTMTSQTAAAGPSRDSTEFARKRNGSVGLNGIT